MADGDLSSICSDDFYKKEKSFYKDKPEWSDVTPIQQDDGPFSVVQIAYSDEFKDVFDYFRAVLKSNEISERAFALTTDAANQNPANYTVWRYRRILLRELKKDFRQELSYISDVIEEHPKNYQNWYHRNVVVGLLGDASNELAFTESILKIDDKNYHAWQHRQWVISKFNIWDNELKFTEKLLMDDVRNNSVWSHRFFVISNTTGFTPEMIESEFKFIKDQVRKVPHNESPWNYLRGVMADQDKSTYPGLMDYLEKLYRDGVRSFYLLSFMIESIEDGMKSTTTKEASTTTATTTNEATITSKTAQLNRCLELCSQLSTQYDTIRAEYWKYLARSLSIQYTEDVK